MTRSSAIANAITGNGSLTKTGEGELELTSINSYTGITYLNAGTLTLSGGNNTLPAAARINFGGSNTLDLGCNSQSLSSLEFTAGSAPSMIDITGADGSLVVNSSSSITQLSTTNQNRPLTLDMSGLSSYTHNGGSQNLRVGLTGSGHSAGGSTPVVTVTLAQTNVLFIIGGIYAGHDWQNGKLVYGVLADIDWIETEMDQSKAA